MRNTINIIQISLYRYKKNSPKDVCDIGDIKAQERICTRVTLEHGLEQCVRVCLANGNGLRSKARKGPGLAKVWTVLEKNSSIRLEKWTGPDYINLYATSYHLNSHLYERKAAGALAKF